ncbi:hydrogenase maturation nickel metallochaperone HypA [candidate division KSB1 bacterium]|nr:MAG: hydrogenase maturation nickel metallochaperone HypA [candidate division KSB1 bacterium]
MHEFSLAMDIFNIVLETAKKEKVKKVYSIKLEVGKLMAVIPDSLLFSFETISRGTILEDTKLEIDEVPVKARCKNCKREFEVNELFFMCPYCKSTDLKIISGRDMFIKSLEVEKNGSDKLKT